MSVAELVFEFSFYFRLVVQYVYQHVLRVFEAVYSPGVVGAYLPSRGIWRNFSHEVVWATPRSLYKTPSTEDQLVEVVLQARKEGRGVRVVGAGHSFNNVTEPQFGAYVVSLHENYKRVLAIEPLETPETGLPGAPPVTAYATVQAGIRLKDLCAQLAAMGYGVHNMGNYYEQTVGGVVATGTHGTTGRYQADTFTSIVVRVRLVNGLGKITELSGEESISLGALGIASTITLRVVDMYWLQHQVTPIRDIVTATATSNIDALLSANDFVFFRWSTIGGKDKHIYNAATVETFNRAKHEDITPFKNITAQAFLIAKYWAFTNTWNNLEAPLWFKSLFVYIGKLFPTSNTDAYYLAYAVPGVVAAHIESEWALPRQKTQEAVQFLSDNASNLFGANTFEIHVRFVPKDKAFMSPAHGRDTVFIDVNLPETVGYSLLAFEDKMREMGGRPHWSKLHNLTYATISKMYDLERFNKLRKTHDPNNIFGGAPYIQQILGNPE